MTTARIQINEAANQIIAACAAIRSAQAINDKQAEAKAKRYRRQAERKLEAAEARLVSEQNG
jgi:hypothetical protein